jgi:hypothetical protein
VGGAYGRHGRDEKWVQVFCLENLKRKDSLGGLDVHGSIILNSML